MNEGKIGPGHQMLIMTDTSRNVESIYDGDTLVAERICGRSAVQMKQ